MSDTISPVIIYDGSCGFCRTAVRFLLPRLALAGTIQPWQSTDLRMHGLTEHQARAQMWFVQGDQRHGGAAAFAAWARTSCTRRTGSSRRSPPIGGDPKRSPSHRKSRGPQGPWARGVETRRHRLTPVPPPGGDPRASHSTRTAARWAPWARQQPLLTCSGRSVFWQVDTCTTMLRTSTSYSLPVVADRHPAHIARLGVCLHALDLNCWVADLRGDLPRM
jgi:hypothetical protein